MGHFGTITHRDSVFKWLKLKLQYFGHLMQRVDSWEKTLMLGGVGGSRRRGSGKGKAMRTVKRAVVPGGRGKEGMSRQSTKDF